MEPGGQVIYLDVKLHSSEQRESTFRTFYYEPKDSTSKINEEATHLLIGFEHDGASRSSRHFLGWRLVDMSRVSLTFKPEFHAGNRDLYKSESLVTSSFPSAPPEAVKQSSSGAVGEQR